MLSILLSFFFGLPYIRNMVKSFFLFFLAIYSKALTPIQVKNISNNKNINTMGKKTTKMIMLLIVGFTLNDMTFLTHWITSTDKQFDEFITSKWQTKSNHHNHKHFSARFFFFILSSHHILYILHTRCRLSFWIVFRLKFHSFFTKNILFHIWTQKWT